ncbi:hypothetical protein [Polymorphospora sp. NPDC050346]|uniref:hypothetical protein n=1 Tax=Polymorphospora sp. NPDC050346 TaxID=3155780 RepID=UPI0033F87998
MAGQTARGTRQQVERAALDLLRDKTALVGQAATDQHAWQELAGKTADALDTYAASYTTALDGGWTAEELDKLGLKTPPNQGTNRRRRTPRQPGPDDVDEPAVDTTA